MSLISDNRPSVLVDFTEDGRLVSFLLRFGSRPYRILFRNPTRSQILSYLAPLRVILDAPRVFVIEPIMRAIRFGEMEPSAIDHTPLCESFSHFGSFSYIGMDYDGCDDDDDNFYRRRSRQTAQEAARTVRKELDEYIREVDNKDKDGHYDNWEHLASDVLGHGTWNSVLYKAEPASIDFD